MFVHCVYFWLKPGISQAEQARFAAGAETLLRIGTVRQGWLGRPADTDRPIIDRSYSYALVVVFDDRVGHDTYQADPVHDAFRTLSPLWIDVKIYDFANG